jgi:outer membrane receptor protein involved in Fe transport
MVSVPAAAQIEEIVITAQKRESTLLDTPIAVSAVGGETIEKAQARDIRDIQTLVPSLQISSFASSTNTSFSIRSIGSSTFNFGIEPAVGVFVDGVYRARNGASINDFLGLERVEVLRGPQSTLFGKNTTAGVINFVTKRPNTEQWEFEGEATYGNLDARIFKAGVSGPIVDDVLAIRLDANLNKRDGFVENTDGRDLNGRDRYGFRGQIYYTPSDDVSFRLIADYNDIDEECCAAPFLLVPETQANVLRSLGATVFDPVDPNNGRTAIDGDIFAEVEAYGFSGTLEWEFENFAFTSITAYRELRDFQNFDADFTDIPLNGQRTVDQGYDTFTQEIRFASTSGETFDWQFGAYYFSQDLFTNNRTVQAPFLRPFIDGVSGGAVTLIENSFGFAPGSLLAAGSGQQRSLFNQDNETFGLFAQLDWHITDRLTLTGGIRYTDDSKDLNTDILIDDPFAALNLINVGAALGLAPALQVSPAQALGIIEQNAQLPADQQNPLINGAVAAASSPAANPLLGLAGFQFFPPAPNLNGQEFNDDDITGNVILSYDLSDEINVYASWSRGYKAGGFALDSSAARVGNFTFDPEVATAWELGFKARAFENTLSVDLALFDQEIEDFQANIFTGTAFVPDNAGSIEVRGLEFEGVYQPNQNFQLTAGFTWLFDSEYGEFPNGPCPTSNNPPAGCAFLPGTTVLVQDLAGQRQSGSATFSGVTTATYTQPISNDLEIYVRGELSYISDVFLQTSLDPNQVQEAFALVGASAGIGAADGKWQLQFWARNLFDEGYVQGSFDATLGGGAINAYPGDPQTYGVTLRFKY